MKWFLGLLLLNAALWLNNPYTTGKDYELTLVSKTLMAGRHSSTPYGLFKMQSGETFTTPISIKTYMSVEPGQRAVLSLRPFDVKQTFWQNLLLLFVPVVFSSVSVVVLIFGIATKISGVKL